MFQKVTTKNDFIYIAHELTSQISNLPHLIIELKP